MGSGLTISIREPMLKTSLSLALKNLLKNTIFDVELWMTQNRQISWSIFVSEQNKRNEFDGNDHLKSIPL